jgi:isopentenyl-diphosphate Delta-isomerase
LTDQSRPLLEAETERRKRSHIETTLQQDVQFKTKKTGFDDVELVHNALPGINRDDVDLRVKLFGRQLSAPLVIESMTGGTPTAAKLNEILGTAAQELGIAIGVGSQRAGIEKPDLAYTYRVVREKAPDAFVFANLGAPQLVKGYGLKEMRKAVEMVDANALCIHLNGVQECIQVEGEPLFRGAMEKIREGAVELGVPIVLKETGAGFSCETAMALERIGVKGVDVAGAGGTSWAAVEYYRAKEKESALHERLGEIFWDWGIPTAASIVEVSRSTKLTVIASGGVRNGLHGAKSLALGASAFGLALPFLKSTSGGLEEVKEKLETILMELRTAMFLTGCKSVEEARRTPTVIRGATGEWLRTRGFDPSLYAKKRSME